MRQTDQERERIKLATAYLCGSLLIVASVLGWILAVALWGWLSEG